MHSVPEREPQEMERELPVLLERVLPQLALPSDRMAQVRLRVQRRRRRRRVAGSAAALAVGCALVAIGLWPAALGPGHAPAEPAVAPTVSQELAPVHLQSPLEGVTMYLPTTWHSLSVRDDHGTAAGFVASQTLRSSATSRCSRITDLVLAVCPPLADLNKNGVLITFLQSETNKISNGVPLVTGGFVPAGKSCRVIGGDTQMTGWARGHSSSAVESPEMKIDVCLREPSQETLSMVEKVLTLAFSSHRG